jgi:hypothetical protein
MTVKNDKHLMNLSVVMVNACRKTSEVLPCDLTFDNVDNLS